MDPPRVPLPRFLQIEPVGQCNLRCKMCPIQFRRDGPPHGPPAFMDFNLFTRLLDGFPHLERLQLQGLGEPMMHPRFFDMVALAAASVWAVLTGRFCLRRLSGTSAAPRHVAEMIATSVLIPPLSVYWRLYGAWKFRVWFA